MKKDEFIATIREDLRKAGYRKSKNYWYKECNGYTCCINVLGSQWDKDDYYVEIGFAYPDANIKDPKLLQWYCRHRCFGVNEDKNILPHELMEALVDVFDQVESDADIPGFLIQRGAVKVVSQFYF